MSTEVSLDTAKQGLFARVYNAVPLGLRNYVFQPLGAVLRSFHALLVLGILTFLLAVFAPGLIRAPEPVPPAPNAAAAANPPDKPCETTAERPSSDKFRILAVHPLDFRRRDAVCVKVENVVTEARLAEVEAAQDKAKKAFADAQKDKADAENEAILPTAPPTAKLKVDVMNGRLEEARKTLVAAGADLAATKAPRGYFLYINEKKSPFVAQAEARAKPQVLTFRLEDSDDATNDLGKFWRQVIVAGKEAHLSIGDGNAASVPYQDGGAVVDQVASRGITMFALMSLTVIALFAWLVILGHRSPLLRVGDKDIKSSFSLARVQMLFWLVLVTGGYLYIWSVTGQWLNVMNSSTFALLGISGVATGAALSIDSNLNPPKPGVPPETVELAKSKGFFRDLATDGDDNVQIQRVQMILWTLILGGIFIWSAAVKLELPPFDANMLALAGIVNGVYVALKVKEPPAGGTPPAPAVAEAPAAVAAPAIAGAPAVAGAPIAGGVVDPNQRGPG